MTSDHDKLDMNNVDFTEKFNRTSSHSRDKDNHSSKSTASTHSNALKLGPKKSTSKTEKSSSKMEKSSSKTEKSSKTRHPSGEPPGSEFDIMRVAVRSSEPDYFADMEPSVNFKERDSKHLPLHSHPGGLSSKLAMVEDTSQV